jgi:uncharacterized protein YbjT (DUF2867 family)
MPKEIKSIVLGSTGMVGEGVLHECLKHPSVTSVLVINRKPCGVHHRKLKEIIHKDFFDISPIENQLLGYNACYFCMGVSSVGKKEEEYRRITNDLTLYIAKKLVNINSDMNICYVSGAGTDSTEKGRIMWARVKGQTENDLLKLPFKEAFMFRPGYIQPTKGLNNSYRIYKVLAPFYPIWKTLLPKYVCSLEEVGLAMINAFLKGYKKPILECKDISQLAEE